MPVSRLALTDFRSYITALIEPGPGFVLLYGENGAGKTNLLEAVSLLTPGRGLRGAALSEMARQGGNGGFAVSASLTLSLGGGPNPSSSGGGAIQIGTGTQPSAPDRRQVRINGAPASVNSLSEWLSILWLTPAMDRLFTGSAGDRRRFLDRLVLALEPSHAHHSSRYEAAMRSRNKLLAEEKWDETWLDSLELAMAEHGQEITRARLRTLKELMPAIAAFAGRDFPTAKLMLANATTQNLQIRLRASRKVHAAAKRSTHGPNNEDLSVVLSEKKMPAAQSSTGEQKALLLGIVLAHAMLVSTKRGAPPILLLDEIAAHLDPKRRATLFGRMEDLGQVWMTGTEEALFHGIGSASRFHVEPGRVSLL